MKTVVHEGLVCVYRISNGWYTHLKFFPEANNPQHANVQKYLKENAMFNKEE